MCRCTSRSRRSAIVFWRARSTTRFRCLRWGSSLSPALILTNFSFIEQMISSAPKWVLAVMIILLFLVFAGYFTFFEWIWSGQTPGKRWLKLRVIREDGRPITFWEASVRNLLRALDMFPVGSYSIGLIAVFSFDARSAYRRHGCGHGRRS